MTKMKNRTPALLRAIARYNALCDRLKVLLPQGETFPLPEKLPDDLARLKNEPALLEDVWLSTESAAAGPWLTDKAVRRGIRAQHVVDRCEEEKLRLAVEDENLYTWVYDEVVALECAVSDPASAFRSQEHGTVTPDPPCRFTICAAPAI